MQTFGFWDAFPHCRLAGESVPAIQHPSFRKCKLRVTRILTFHSPPDTINCRVSVRVLKRASNVDGFNTAKGDDGLMLLLLFRVKPCRQNGEHGYGMEEQEAWAVGLLRAVCKWVLKLWSRRVLCIGCESSNAASSG